jgi:hypothetical protein
MDPSIRSSAPRAVNVRFLRTEPALHEATQRVVESLMRDVRVSQFADLKYASTLLQKGTWYWLPGGKGGFLVMAPKSPIVWMEEQGKVSYKIPMRVGKEWCEKGTVCLASLNLTDGILRLEDMRCASGKNMEMEPFSKRWDALLDFYRNSYIQDSVLQGGLVIEPAVYSSLESASQWDDTTPMFMIAQGETFKKRVRVQIRDKDMTPVVERIYPPTREPSQLLKQKGRTAAPAAKPQAKAPAAAAAAAAAYVVPSKEFPDTYVLYVNGENKGFAAVQGLSLSRSLRDASKTSEKIPVNVTWNTEFSSHEIVSIVE